MVTRNKCPWQRHSQIRLFVGTRLPTIYFICLCLRSTNSSQTLLQKKRFFLVIRWIDAPRNPCLEGLCCVLHAAMYVIHTLPCDSIKCTSCSRSCPCLLLRQSKTVKVVTYLPSLSIYTAVLSRFDAVLFTQIILLIPGWFFVFPFYLRHLLRYTCCLCASFVVAPQPKIVCAILSVYVLRRFTASTKKMLEQTQCMGWSKWTHKQKPIANEHERMRMDG